jgi:hypothetical protein
MKIIRKVLYYVKRRWRSLCCNNVIYGYDEFVDLKVGDALLYYKIFPFLNKYDSVKYTYHSNNWQILELAKQLNLLGLSVDIIDRDSDINKIKLSDKYEVFIGLAVGNSGKNFASIASMVPSAKRIIYAAGPEPTLSNKLIKERYLNLYKRRGASLEPRRVITKVDFSQCISNADAIFCVGNSFAINSFKRFDIPIYQIYPSTYPGLSVTADSIRCRSSRKFIYFGGNGAIVKGLDLLIEAFSTNPGLELYICSPYEQEIFDIYGEIFENNNNIHWVGFVHVNSESFNRLASICSFVVLPSCSEGIATSVAACMRKGLIPIVTPESGIDVEDFGFSIVSTYVNDIEDIIQTASLLNKNEIFSRSSATVLGSLKYTQASFTLSIVSAFSRISLVKANKVYK